MNPPPSEFSPSAVWRSQRAGLLLFFTVVLGSQYVANGLRGPVMKWLALHGGSPGDAPPWYFITQDFAQGIGSAAAILLCLLAAVVVWRWWPDYAAMMVWMPVLFLGGHVWRSWIIYQACPGLLEGQRVATHWPTFDSYLHDAETAHAEMVVRVGAVGLAVGLSLANYQVMRWRRGKIKAES